jgi:hypothetical protein
MRVRACVCAFTDHACSTRADTAHLARKHRITVFVTVHAYLDCNKVKTSLVCAQHHDVAANVKPLDSYIEHCCRYLHVCLYTPPQINLKARLYALCSWRGCIHMNGPQILASVYVYICTCDYTGWVHTKRRRCCNALCHAHIPVHNYVYGHARSAGTAASIRVKKLLCRKRQIQNMARARDTHHLRASEVVPQILDELAMLLRQ